MKIIDNTKSNDTINDINIGDSFLFDGCYYIKIYSGITWNCVDLSRGILTQIQSDVIITPVNATVVIE